MSIRLYLGRAAGTEKGLFAEGPCSCLGIRLPGPPEKIRRTAAKRSGALSLPRKFFAAVNALQFMAAFV